MGFGFWVGFWMGELGKVLAFLFWDGKVGGVFCMVWG